MWVAVWHPEPIKAPFYHFLQAVSVKDQDQRRFEPAGQGAGYSRTAPGHCLGAATQPPSQHPSTTCACIAKGLLSDQVHALDTAAWESRAAFAPTSVAGCCWITLSLVVVTPEHQHQHSGSKSPSAVPTAMPSMAAHKRHKAAAEKVTWLPAPAPAGQVAHCACSHHAPATMWQDLTRPCSAGGCLAPTKAVVSLSL